MNGSCAIRIKDIAAKLSHKFSGPYKVVRWLSPLVFRLVDTKGKYAGKEHVKHRRPYVASTDQSGADTLANGMVQVLGKVSNADIFVPFSYMVASESLRRLARGRHIKGSLRPFPAYNAAENPGQTAAKISLETQD